jgi:SHS2 domain-containing protein
MPPDLIPFEEFEHAADLGLRARGRTMEELFANAARGMLWLLGCEPCPEGGGVERMIELEGLDPEHLLVRWLSEILYIYREGKAASGFVFDSIEETSLKARCRLESLPGDFVPKREIKLVTHHGASIRERAGILEAEVVLDV